MIYARYQDALAYSISYNAFNAAMLRPLGEAEQAIYRYICGMAADLRTLEATRR